MSEQLRRDMACGGLLECFHGLEQLGRECFRALVDTHRRRDRGRRRPRAVDRLLGRPAPPPGRVHPDGADQLPRWDSSSTSSNASTVSRTPHSRPRAKAHPRHGLLPIPTETPFYAPGFRRLPPSRPRRPLGWASRFRVRGAAPEFGIAITGLRPRCQSSLPGRSVLVSTPDPRPGADPASSPSPGVSRSSGSRSMTPSFHVPLRNQTAPSRKETTAPAA